MAFDNEENDMDSEEENNEDENFDEE